jgi:hypothetical protein
LACLSPSLLVAETRDPRETLDRKDPPVRKGLRAYRVLRGSKAQRALKVLRVLRVHPARRATREKLQS